MDPYSSKDDESDGRQKRRRGSRTGRVIIGALPFVKLLFTVIRGVFFIVGSFAEPVNHMRIKIPEVSKAVVRQNTPLVVTNQCSDIIYAAVNTQSGQGPSKTGFKLETGGTLNQTVSENWQGRVWGRTNCSFNAASDGPANGRATACGTGDCAGKVACEVSGLNPVTLAEFTLDAGDGQTYYDISLVDGYNLPMAIIKQPLGNSSLDDIPPNLTNPSCEGSPGELAPPTFNPYNGGQQVFLGTNSSFPLAFDTKVSDGQVSSWCPYNLLVSPPSKPGDGVYPYPDDNVKRPAFSPCLSACAKWNKASDCCTGNFNSPGACSPSDYSKAAKKVCPDAYSYAFDDQTSTFIIPSGAGFEVVFCPGMGHLTSSGHMSGSANNHLLANRPLADPGKPSGRHPSFDTESPPPTIPLCNVYARPCLLTRQLGVPAECLPRFPDTSVEALNPTSRYPTHLVVCRLPFSTVHIKLFIMTVPPLTKQPLDTGWVFKQSDAPEDDWLPAPLVPSCVHQDLIANKKIPDPFLGFNEIEVEWVGEKPWTYKTSLPVHTTPGHDGRKYVLAFDGLDTYATVQLNGRVILKSDNMFHSHRVDITEKLSSDSRNVLEVSFLPALEEAKKIEAAHPEHKWVGFNADMARLAVRKAQYHFGWDWGPILITSGIWKEVRLETYHARLKDVRIDYELDQDLKNVSGVITSAVEGHEGSKVLIRGEIESKPAFQVEAEVDDYGIAKARFSIDSPALWWPHGYGNQPLYSVKSTLLSADGTEIDEHTQRLGIRKAKLIRQPDDGGKSFFFQINDTDIFCGGSDWIPADSFLPRITTARYRSWLQTMVDGNQVMVRIWGGGIYEAEAFYDACDELGILVWQDFMFGCGNYPAWQKMRESIRLEATQNVKRLQKHTSVVLYAGNNEDYQVQEQFGLTYNYKDKNPENWLKTDFPARYIYEKVPESPSVPYHPGSPWGDGLPTSDRTVGDLHQWNVWHGSQEKYQILDTLGGRFNSEFGLEAFPHIDTIKHYVTDDSQLYPQSHMLDFHNKADGHERRIATYLVENFRTVTDLEGHIHLTQLSQAEALMFGYRGWRRQWGQKRFCGGALVWQLNDCWPVTSWSIIDYFQRKKPAYYAMRRALAPVAVAVKRAHHDWSVAHARPAKTSAWELWASSSKTHEVVGTVELRFISIATGKDIKQSVTKTGVRIVANGTTEVLSGTIDNEAEEAHVLAARLWIDGHADVVSRDMDWPQPLKYLDFSERGVEVVQDGGSVRVTAQRPTKSLVFEERHGVLADDSALDVAPGDVQVVRLRGLGQNARPLGWRYLGQPWTRGVAMT
ncbi:uncharacterized protein IWZ02DRAFT_474219 [Phyllosticta citriasiana]|uniref:uncharacterized protein n=1 Tax=Phyllosticta citriasiana TaxID=595635 RepID=UPI0030FD8C17